MSTLEGGPWQAAGGYLEHLTSADLALLGGVAGNPPAERLREDPALVERLLDDRRSFQLVFGGEGRADPLLQASPFLVFALAIQRGTEDLRGAAFVGEWAGPRRRLPVFDTASLRDFLAAPSRRLFLAELLASYVHVASGSVLVQTRRGWRRQRFSELDPVRLAALLDVVPEGERVGIYRRLGDLALFLTGVFPDHTATRAFGPVHAERLLRHAGVEGTEAREALAAPSTGSGGVALLERLGRRWYRLAYQSAPVRTAPLRVMDEVAQRFDQARRILNLVTDNYLFPFRARWFPGPASGG
jgi:DNA-binding transcriptional ArsR family regulator